MVCTCTAIFIPNFYSLSIFYERSKLFTKSIKCLINIYTNIRSKKFGAALGDFVEVGCGSVLNPGTVVGRNSNIYPLSSVRGFVEENSIFKSQDNQVKKA